MFACTLVGGRLGCVGGFVVFFFGGGAFGAFGVFAVHGAVPFGGEFFGVYNSKASPLVVWGGVGRGEGCELSFNESTYTMGESQLTQIAKQILLTFLHLSHSTQVELLLPVV